MQIQSSCDILYKVDKKEANILFIFSLVSPRNNYFDYFLVSPFESLLKCWKILKVLKSLRFYDWKSKIENWLSGEREKKFCMTKFFENWFYFIEKGKK